MQAHSSCHSAFRRAGTQAVCAGQRSPTLSKQTEVAPPVSAPTGLLHRLLSHITQPQPLPSLPSMFFPPRPSLTPITGSVCPLSKPLNHSSIQSSHPFISQGPGLGDQKRLFYPQWSIINFHFTVFKRRGKSMETINPDLKENSHLRIIFSKHVSGGQQSKVRNTRTQSLQVQPQQLLCSHLRILERLT